MPHAPQGSAERQPSPPELEAATCAAEPAADPRAGETHCAVGPRTAWPSVQWRTDGTAPDATPPYPAHVTAWAADPVGRGVPNRPCGCADPATNDPQWTHQRIRPGSMGSHTARASVGMSV
jgi:hypothetical protein